MKAHDFKEWPELTNSQMEIHYFASPHKQITEDFRARVVKIIDGDTIRVKADLRNFDFPVRLFGIDAPELGEEGGREAALWLKNRILGKEVDIIINQRHRVGKFGRLLGDVNHNGESMSEAMLREMLAVVFGMRHDPFPHIEELSIEGVFKKWP